MTERPKLALLISTTDGPATLARTLSRIAPDVVERVHEILVFGEQADGLDPLELPELAAPVRQRLRVFRLQGTQSNGRRQKSGYDYALRKGYDIIATLRGDGRNPPEALGELVEPVERGQADVVIACRPRAWRAARRQGAALEEVIRGRVVTALQNRLGATTLSDVDSDYRVYRCAALGQIPYQRGRDDSRFHHDVLLQLLAGGSRIVERPVPWAPGRSRSLAAGMRDLLAAMHAVVRYRLHRDGLVFVDTFEIGPPRYPLKTNRWSSHQQMARLVPPGHRVLDIGCGDGAMAQRLSRRGCVVVGVDQRVGPAAIAACERTYTCDLDQGLGALDGEPPFQTILLADVLSHITEYDRLLSDCRRHLAAEGRVVISVGNVAHLTVRLSLLLGRFEYTPRGILERKHVVLFTLGSVTRLLATHGFRVVRVHVTPVPFEALWPGAARQWWVQALTAIAYGLARVWKTLFAYQFILVAEPGEVAGLVEPVAVPDEDPLVRTISKVSVA